MVHPGMTCQDWTSGAPVHQGANGELDQQYLLKVEIQPCSTTLAVVCVGVGKAASYGPCPTPGKPCKATDPCAVNPVCGEDKICRPSHVLNCEDNLPCTKDSCDGKGGCKHTPKDGYCLINGQCHNDGDGDPSGCARCDSKTNKTAWTSLSGGCVIDGKCYKKGETDATRCQACDPAKDANGWSARTDPHCKVNGVCYDKDAKHPQACAHCDPSKSKTSLIVDASFCLIDDKCLISGAKDPSGCRSCDPTSSKTSWTTDSDACVIDDVCRKKGDKHPGGCAECDPGTSQSAWTVVTTTDCLIDGGCHAAGTKHPGGCAECKPATSQTSWTVTGAACLINGTCHQSGALDPIGCYKCDPAKSKTKWTAISGCYKIVLGALNEAHSGSLGGISGADALCAKQAKAAGYAGTFKAFLSGAARDVKDLVSAANASQPVINTLGQQLYGSWSQVFTQSTFSGGYIHSFDGKKVDEGSGASPDWYDARNWHGSQMSGLVSAGQTCQDWTSALSSHSGAGAELDMHRLLSSTTNTCNRTLAVVCVQTAAAP
jgi:hypothetical protein